MPTGSLLLTAFLALQDAPTITLAQGADLRHLRVVAIREATLDDDTALDDVAFLPLELTARTSADAWRPDRPHLGAVPGGPTRVELPGGAALYHYQRDQDRFGWLLITAGGRPVVLVERRGSGTPVVDPFAAHVAVSADGSAAAVATAGEVLQLRLDGQRFASTGAPVRVAATVAARPRSLLMGAAALFVQATDRQLLRCARVDAAQPESVALGSAPPALLEEEMALAGDGSTVAVLAGSDPTQLELFLVGATGAAQVVSPRPGAWLAPGYLPQDPRGPHLALSDDGQQVAFGEGGRREDFWLWSAPGPARQFNTVANFNPYVDIGVFFIFVGPVLTLGLGDDPDGVDLYRVRDTGGGFAITNLTLTSGIAQPPFGGRPTLDVVAVHRAPGGTLAVVHREPGGLALRLVDPATARATVLATGLLAPPAAQPAGPGLFPDLIADAADQSRLWFPSATGLVEALALPAAFPLRRSVRRGSDGSRLISVDLLPGVAATFAVPVPWDALLLRTTPQLDARWTRGLGVLLSEAGSDGVRIDYFRDGVTARIDDRQPFALVLNHAAR